MQYFLWACLLGGLSAVSLPLGSWVGLKFKFSAKQISILAAFGAGALLAALSVELVAPTTLALAGGHDDHSTGTSSFYALLIGCITGGLLYVLLDKAVNSKGGFMRKTSTLMSYYKKQQNRQQEEILTKLSRIPLFHNFPTDRVNDLLTRITPKKYKKGEVLLEQGSDAFELLLVLEGEASFFLRGDGEPIVISPKQHAIVNLLPMLTNKPVMADLVANEQVIALSINRGHFEELRKISPDFDHVCRETAKERIESALQFVSQKQESLVPWMHDAQKAVLSESSLPDVPFMIEARKEHSGSPLAIWLGILLDGIPESVVIGAGMLGLLTAKLAARDSVGFADVVPFTLIAGLFLSNFPEALSSSSNMLKSGMSRRRIFLLWSSLTLMTALGAGIGYVIAGELSHTFIVGMEGVAAGAMLTMTAAAMIPEAVVLGTGNVVGLSTLTGFLGAIVFKLFE